MLALFVTRTLLLLLLLSLLLFVQTRVYRRAYYAAVSYTDDLIGKVCTGVCDKMCTWVRAVFTTNTPPYSARSTELYRDVCGKRHAIYEQPNNVIP